MAKFRTIVWSKNFAVYIYIYIYMNIITHPGKKINNARR